MRVAVGVIRRQAQVLIAQRPLTAHQGGLWEFPGGKIEADETPLAALSRELAEEVGIRVTQADAILDIHWEYVDKTVRLEVYCIDSFSGDPRGLEGQTVRWVDVSDLKRYSFPKANAEIVDWLVRQHSL